MEDLALIVSVMVLGSGATGLIALVTSLLARKYNIPRWLPWTFAVLSTVVGIWFTTMLPALGLPPLVLGLMSLAALLIPKRTPQQ